MKRVSKLQKNDPIYTPDSEVARRLLAWYDIQGRDLPWRVTRDPYRIWVSEIILQQTRVAQGTAYYHRFVEQFPNVGALAAASEDRVLKCWQGLGYYSRARNLRAAAQRIVVLHGGIFPTDYPAVRALPGVGEYTAAAICSMAFDAPRAVLDGNVFRVLARLYDLDVPIDISAGRRSFALLADALLDRRLPGRYNQAIMDFGALCCTPLQPRCGECPLRDRCLALAAETVALRPIKQGRTTVERRYFNYLHLECGEELLLCRRAAPGIWRGLYEFPLIESPRSLAYAELAATPEFQDLFEGVRALHRTRTVTMPVHQLSHRAIHAVFHRIIIDRWTERMCCGLIVPREVLSEYAIPRLLDRYLIENE